MSISPKAENPAIIIVIPPKIQINQDQLKFSSTPLMRIKRYTPAVTSVDECTRAETGVGAAIAAGSQEEKGI